jgi:hypothetical protein
LRGDGRALRGRSRHWNYTGLMQQWTRMAFVVLALPLWAACAVIVDPESLQIRCDMALAVAGHDPCPIGEQCMNGICRSCDPDARELCNGRDDDCDGEVDEGQDADGDGFTWCGGGRVELVDCVDRDPKIHPAPIDDKGNIGEAPAEVCDGKDNDCDSKVDEDQSCATTKKCTETGCPENQTCDEPSGICIVPRPVGSGCMSDSDCKAGFCLRPGSFNLPVALMDNRCATACCSKSDCDDGSTCVIARSGARVCLPNNIVGGGTRKPGDRCSDDDECNSGLCARGQCQTRCFASEGCASTECMLSPGSATETRLFWCGEPLGRIETGEQCYMIGCRSGYCTDDFVCAAPCARDADCDKDSYCKMIDVRPGLIGPASSVSICAPKPTGSPDTESTEHLCCTNDDCAGQLCAPNSPRTNQWNMSCRMGEQVQ